MEIIKITFCGAARVVTGSCYLLEHGESKFLVDCGMFQGTKELKDRNYGDFLFNPNEIDFVLLTHAHIDHTGLVPKLYKSGFSGPTYGTSGTVELCKVMLADSGHIHEMEISWKNRKALRSGKPLLTPLYTVQDAEDCMKHFNKIAYDHAFEPAPGIRVVMRDAGHILGSAMLEIYYQNNGVEEKFVFTGDLGREDQPIINDPTIIEEADYLVMESTYGSRQHEEVVDNDAMLAKAINDTFRRGGNVVIPAFAVDRTQDLLITLNKLIEEDQIDPHAIYMDSPLAIAATEIFCRHPQYYDEETKELMIGQSKGMCPFLLPNMNFARSTEESVALNNIKKGAIIISASGMADAGRIRHHLKHNLWRPECTIIFVGYQAEGTLGRKLVDGESPVKLLGEEITVRANIVVLEGYSAHADQSELMDWLSHFKKMPKKIFVTHGEEASSIYFAELLKGKYHSDTLVPSIGETYEIAGVEMECIQEGVSIKPAIVEEIQDYYVDEINRLIKDMPVEKLKAIIELLKFTV